MFQRMFFNMFLCPHRREKTLMSAGGLDAFRCFLIFP